MLSGRLKPRHSVSVRSAYWCRLCSTPVPPGTMEVRDDDVRIIALVRGADPRSFGEQGGRASAPPRLRCLFAALPETPPSCAAHRECAGTVVSALSVCWLRCDGGALAFDSIDAGRLQPRLQQQ